MLELDRELARFEKLPLPTDAEGARLGALLFDAGKIEALVAELDGRIEGMAIFPEDSIPHPFPDSAFSLPRILSRTRSRSQLAARCSGELRAPARGIGSFI